MVCNQFTDQLIHRQQIIVIIIINVIIIIVCICWCRSCCFTMFIIQQCTCWRTSIHEDDHTALGINVRARHFTNTLRQYWDRPRLQSRRGSSLRQPVIRCHRTAVSACLQHHALTWLPRLTAYLYDAVMIISIFKCSQSFLTVLHSNICLLITTIIIHTNTKMHNFKLKYVSQCPANKKGIHASYSCNLCACNLQYYQQQDCSNKLNHSPLHIDKFLNSSKEQSINIIQSQLLQCQQTFK